MLTSRGHWSNGTSTIDTVVVLDRACRAQATRRAGLLFDARFLRPAGPPRGVVTLYLVARGTTELAGRPPLEGPAIFVLAEREFECRTPGALPFRSWGRPAIVMDLCVPASEVRVPIGLVHGPTTMPAALSDHLEALFQTGDAGAEQRFMQVVEALEKAGVVTARLLSRIGPDEPPHLRRLWDAVKIPYERHDTGAYLDLFTQLLRLSPRQVQRDLRELTERFGLHGFRAALKTMRVRRAVLLLSAEECSVGEVARLVGYGSADAMGRAFRDAGLPPPSAVAAEVRFPEGSSAR